MYNAYGGGIIPVVGKYGKMAYRYCGDGAVAATGHQVAGIAWLLFLQLTTRSVFCNH